MEKNNTPKAGKTEKNAKNTATSTKKTTKKVTVKSYKTTKKTIRNLKSNKKYYVRIRTYKVVKGKKYYSYWSKVKSI